MHQKIPLSNENISEGKFQIDKLFLLYGKSLLKRTKIIFKIETKLNE